MITNINANTLDQIQNPVFRKYASTYVDYYDEFLEFVKTSGIEFDTESFDEESKEIIRRVDEKGATLRNRENSVCANSISPSCIACQTGKGSVTYFISLRCHRKCFYCFNPNQDGFDHFSEEKNERNLISELNNAKERGAELEHIALTGGEPLLYKQEAVEFFSHAKKTYPKGYTRLYTSGDHVNEELLQELKDSNLDEIRFSVRLHDQEQGIQHTLDRIKLAKEYIPFVMVEMPVVPFELEKMKEVLRELNELEIFSINLLEFCYPYFNSEVFVERNFKVKKQPFRVLYNYWYAGGLPVSQSELDCLKLVEFALDEGLTMGVHYCSLENKQTAQIYQQNKTGGYPEIKYFSKNDYFLKSAKVFGEDIPEVQQRLRKAKGAKFEINEEHGYLEFQVHKIKELKGMDIEVGISSFIMHPTEDGLEIKELQVDLCNPDQFDFAIDG